MREDRRSVPCARDDLAVALDGNPTISQAELVDQRCDGGTCRYRPGCTVHDDVEAIRHGAQPTSKCLTREAKM